MNKENLKFILKQFPYIYPKGFIRSAKLHIEKLINKDKLYSKNRSAQYYLIDEGETYFLPPPNGLQPQYLSGFTLNQAYKTTEKYLFFLPDSFITGNEGITANNRNYIYEDFAHHFNISSLKGNHFNKPFQNFSLNIKPLSGTTASLLCPEPANVYHWFFDVLARIRFYEPVIDQIDHFLISDAVPQSFIDLLPLFSIPIDKIVRVKGDEKLHLKYLYISSLAGSEGRSSQKDLAYLNDKLRIAAPQIGTEKFYLRRGKSTTRAILNEEELIVILKANGFTIVDSGELSFEEQKVTFSRAAIVVAFHGASLFNLLFVPKNCKVLELFSPDYFRTDCYYNLASLKQLRYWYLVGEKAAKVNWGDTSFNPHLFSDLLKQVANNE
ncbi:hypothetical protein DHW03_16590 [Pedobacter yonginense]|uniref:Glycosyltransferase 61 catalytic domain-containing protein n=1 Tax=Pedobacter yonginense TaxID=651869 RepID=A0A317EMY0_9SPHI|nr:glycosyltransferase family 61 protein [Pedobacter yonginense]PWS26398.1 hypothetical protein DHW03_16590 [Pedobacter yonginense]